MPRVTTNQTNFTAGEVSPKCYGRVDVARYQNGAAAMPNCIVNLHGGAERRPGSIFIAEVKDSTKRVRLIPFVFSTTQAYVLEFGHLYMRVYLQSGGQILAGSVPYEIVTPYTDAMLDALDYTQGADTMFLFHRNVPIHTLKRVASDFWAIQPAPITVAPFDEIGHTFGSTLALSSAAVGVGRTLTASFATFLAGDVGRRITYQSGTAIITGYTSSTVVTATIQTAFPTPAIPSNLWTLADSPQTTLAPSAKDPVGIVITLTSATNSFRLEDVGKFVRINGGLVLITGFTSAVNVSGIIKEELASTVGSPASAWTLESSVWNALNGYPATGALYEQRLVVAGSIQFPQTVWGSRSGLFFDFTIGVNDDDGFSFTLPSTGQINPIQRMASAKALMPLTYGGEYTMSGGGDGPITPTSVKALSPSIYGCNNVKPMRVGNEVLFVQRAGRKIRSLAYRIESDTYNAPDLTVLAEHITRFGITDMAFQQEPRSVIWCVRGDGKLATLTLDRDEGITAWSPQETDGIYEAIASIPIATIVPIPTETTEEVWGDEVWCVVQRLIGNSVKRYVERFDTRRYTDCGISGFNIGSAAVWTNLNHLEGEQVAVKADGVYMGLFTVTAGQITLPRNAFTVEIGVPFTNSVTLLRPELQAGDGTAQGNATRVHEVSMLLMETIGMKINGEEIAFREFGENLLDLPPEAYSGFKRAGLTDWARSDEQKITVSQDEPYPFHLLAVVRKITVNS
jgi:hypothetical protein